MLSKYKSSRPNYLSKTILVICELKKLGQSYCKIAYHLQIPKFSIIIILHRKVRQSDNLLKSSKPLEPLFKQDVWASQLIIYYVEKFLHDNLNILSTLFKSGHTIGWTIIWQYLKAIGFFLFKIRKKPFLSNKHKAARLKQAKKY